MMNNSAMAFVQVNGLFFVQRILVGYFPVFETLGVLTKVWSFGE